MGHETNRNKNTNKLATLCRKTVFLAALICGALILTFVSYAPSIAEQFNYLDDIYQKNTESQGVEVNSEEQEFIDEAEEVTEETRQKSIFEDAVVNSSSNEAFNISWYNGYTTTSSVYTTPVNYVGTTDEGATYNDIDPFMTDSFRRDFIGSTSRLSGDETYRESHFDVRYFEETYETGTKGQEDYHKWAFCGCYVSVNGTRYDMSKMAFYRTNNQNRLYYLDDLKNASWTYVGNVSASATIEIYICFKDVSKYGIDAVDFRTHWKYTEGQTEHDVKALVQYMYYDPNDSGGKTYKHMDPPFAGDLNLSPATSQQFQSNSTMTFSNYCGRYVDQFIEDSATHAGEKKPCVYYTAAVATPTDTQHESSAKWHIASNIQFTRTSEGAINWYYTNEDGSTQFLKTYDSDYEETSTAYTGENVWINFIYRYDETSVTSAVDSKMLGVEINLFDYDTWLGTGGSARYQGGINYDYGNTQVNAYRFASGLYNESDTWNAYTNGRSRRVQNNGTSPSRTGIWENKLVNGYPTVVSEWYTSRTQRTTVTGTKDLKYLLDPNLQNQFKRSYKDLNGLFDAKAFEEYGYYLYGSSREMTIGETTFPGRFAQIRKKPSPVNQSSNEELREDFVLYTNVSRQIDDNEDVYFMPFGDKDNPSESNYDFHFGMTIKTDFLMPKDGIAVNVGSKGTPGPMVFHFNGDDDVYVYIDDALMLDLGGIHQEISGNIDFASAQVIITEGTTTTTIWMDDMYQEAFPDWDKTKDSKWVKLSDSNHYRLADYTTHRMNFYYFERGTGSSNCEIAFNMHAIPPGSLLLGKDVDNNSSIAHLDGKFHYKVQVAEYDPETTHYGEFHDYVSPLDEQGRPIPINVYKGSIYEWDPDKVVDQITMTAEDHGQVSISDDNVAVLNGFNVNDQFKIVEFDPRQTITPGEDDPSILDLLWKVFYNGVQVTEDDKIQIDYYETPEGPPITSWGYGTSNLYVGVNNGIQFTNQVSDNSLFDLVIDKDAVPVGNVGDADVLVCFNGSTDSEGRPVGPEPYVGDYWFVDENNNHKEDNPRHTDGEPIHLNEASGYDRILIEGVQMEVRATVYVVNDLQFKNVSFWHNEYDEALGFQSGNICLSYDGSPAGFYACRIPFVLTAASIDHKDKYCEIDFSVSEEPYSLKFEKQIRGAFADKQTEFVMSPILYIPDGGGGVIPFLHTSIESPILGYFHDNSKETDIDILAVTNANGEFLISSDGGKTYKYPSMAHYDYILLREVLNPLNNITEIRPFEQTQDDFKPTFFQVTADLSDISMDTPYVPLSPGTLTYVTTESTQSIVQNEGNYVFVQNQWEIGPETLLDIFKDPQWIMMIIALLVILIAAMPTKLYFARLKSKKNAVNTKETFEIIEEDFDIW